MEYIFTEYTEHKVEVNKMKNKNLTTYDKQFVVGYIDNGDCVLSTLQNMPYILIYSKYRKMLQKYVKTIIQELEETNCEIFVNDCSLHQPDNKYVEYTDTEQILKRLLAIDDQRKKLFASNGVMDIGEYNRVCCSQMQSVILVLRIDTALDIISENLLNTLLAGCRHRGIFVLLLSSEIDAISPLMLAEFYTKICLGDCSNRSLSKLFSGKVGGNLNKHNICVSRLLETTILKEK